MIDSATQGERCITLTIRLGAGEQRRFEWEVTHTIGGQRLCITAHAMCGDPTGPTLVVVGGMHGDELGSFPVIAEFWSSLDVESLRGTVVVAPVANPLALGAHSRFTPDLHGTTDLHATFPGSPTGTLTQQMAHVITRELIEPLGAEDVFVDVHAGGAGGRLQFRVDFDRNVQGTLRERTLHLCRSYGTVLIHENNLAATASKVANDQGTATVNVEVGGSYLDHETERHFTSRGVAGLRSLAAEAGILDRESQSPILPEQQWLYDTENRIEINPRQGGYLRSFLTERTDLDQEVAEGQVLGEIIDSFTLEVREQLVAPVVGFLFFTRRSGVVESGAKVYGIARKAGARCL